MMGGEQPGNPEDEFQDIAEGSAGGVSGTPGFFIGKSSPDGKITGTPLVGAQPYAAFKTIIDQQLK
jgi:protein-disulfide isomerase